MSNNKKFEISLKLILKNNKGETLLLEIIDLHPLSGFYDLPGGRIQEGEENLNFVEVLKREVSEEIGNVQLSISPKPVGIAKYNYFGSFNKPENGVWIFFEGKFIGGKPEVSEEHKSYKWVRITKTNLPKFFSGAPLEGMKSYFIKNDTNE